MASGIGTSAVINVSANTRGMENDIQKALNKFQNSEIKMGRSGQALGRITGQVDEFTKSLDASNARVIAFGASAGAIMMIEKAFSGLIKSTIEVEKSLTDVNVLLNLSSANLEKFGSSLFSVAKNTGTSFSVVAEAATELSRQGLGVEETLKRTNAALILTRLSGMGAAESVSTLTATINSFGSSALDATEIVNKLANVDAAFAVSSGDLANAISRVGSTASDAGVSLDELIALVTSAQQITARGGAVIGNSFKTIFTRLQRGKVQGLLESLGIKVDDGQNAISLLKQLAGVYDTLGSAQKSMVAEQVGGVFQINILKAALGDLGKQFSIYDRALQISTTSTDEAIKRNKLLNETISSLSNEAFVNLEQAATKIGNLSFAPNAKSFLKGFNDILSSFNSIDPESSGGKFINGFFKGIGNFISGPGTVLFFAVMGKLLVNLSKFGAGAVKEVLGLNAGVKQQEALEKSIGAILGKNMQLTQGILSGKMSTVQVEKEVLSFLQAQTLIMEKQAQLAKVIAVSGIRMGATIGASGIPNIPMSVSKSGKSSGFIPNFTTGQALESIGAANHKNGYTAGQAYTTTVHDGTGKSHQSFVNSAETVKTVRNAAGHQATFVIPPNGFGPNTQYAASGFTPEMEQKFMTGRMGSQARWMRDYLKKNQGRIPQSAMNDPKFMDHLGSVFAQKYGENQALMPFSGGFLPNFATKVSKISSLLGVKSGAILNSRFNIGEITTDEKTKKRKKSPEDLYTISTDIERFSLPYTLDEYNKKASNIANLIRLRLKENKKNPTPDFNPYLNITHDGNPIGEFLNKKMDPSTLLKDGGKTVSGNISNIKGALGEADSAKILKSKYPSFTKVIDTAGIDFATKDGRLWETKVTQKKVKDEVAIAKSLNYLGFKNNNRYKTNNSLDTISLPLISFFEARKNSTSSNLSGGFIPNFANPLETYLKSRSRPDQLAAQTFLAETKFKGDKYPKNSASSYLNDLIKGSSQIPASLQAKKDASAARQENIQQSRIVGSLNPFAYILPNRPKDQKRNIAARTSEVDKRFIGTKSWINMNTPVGGMQLDGPFKKEVDKFIVPGIEGFAKTISSKIKGAGAKSLLAPKDVLAPVYGGLFEAVHGAITGKVGASGASWDLPVIDQDTANLFGSHLLGKTGDMKSSFEGGAPSFFEKVIKDGRGGLSKALDEKYKFLQNKKGSLSSGFFPNFASLNSLGYSGRKGARSPEVNEIITLGGTNPRDLNGIVMSLFGPNYALAEGGKSSDAAKNVALRATATSTSGGFLGGSLNLKPQSLYQKQFSGKAVQANYSKLRKAADIILSRAGLGPVWERIKNMAADSSGEGRFSQLQQNYIERNAPALRVALQSAFNKSGKNIGVISNAPEGDTSTPLRYFADFKNTSQKAVQTNPLAFGFLPNFSRQGDVISALERMADPAGGGTDNERRIAAEKLVELKARGFTKQENSKPSHPGLDRDWRAANVAKFGAAAAPESGEPLSFAKRFWKIKDHFDKKFPKQDSRGYGKAENELSFALRSGNLDGLRAFAKKYRRYGFDPNFAGGFIPNFASIKDTMSLESQLSGRSAQFYTKPFPHIRNSSQPTFESAMADHGGLNNALKDSIAGQKSAGLLSKGFVPNFADGSPDMEANNGLGFAAAITGLQGLAMSLAFMGGNASSLKKELKDLEGQFKMTPKAMRDFERRLKTFNNSSSPDTPAKIAAGQALEKERVARSSYTNTKKELSSERGKNSLYAAGAIAQTLLPSIAEMMPKGTGGQRGSAQLVESAGNVAGWASTGAMVGGPWGAAIGASIGVLAETDKVITSFNSKVPELEMAAQKAAESFQKTSEGGARFLSISASLKEAKDNPFTKSADIDKLQSQYQSILSELSSADQKALTSTINLSEQQDILAEIIAKRGVEASVARDAGETEKGNEGRSQGVVTKALNSVLYFASFADPSKQRGEEGEKYRNKIVVDRFTGNPLTKRESLDSGLKISNFLTSVKDDPKTKGINESIQNSVDIVGQLTKLNLRAEQSKSPEDSFSITNSFIEIFRKKMIQDNKGAPLSQQQESSLEADRLKYLNPESLKSVLSSTLIEATQKREQLVSSDEGTKLRIDMEKKATAAFKKTKDGLDQMAASSSEAYASLKLYSDLQEIVNKGVEKRTELRRSSENNILSALDQRPNNNEKISGLEAAQSEYKKGTADSFKQLAEGAGDSLISIIDAQLSKVNKESSPEDQKNALKLGDLKGRIIGGELDRTGSAENLKALFGTFNSSISELTGDKEKEAAATKALTLAITAQLTQDTKLLAAMKEQTLATISASIYKKAEETINTAAKMGGGFDNATNVEGNQMTISIIKDVTDLIASGFNKDSNSNPNSNQAKLVARALAGASDFVGGNAIDMNSKEGQMISKEITSSFENDVEKIISKLRTAGVSEGTLTNLQDRAKETQNGLGENTIGNVQILKRMGFTQQAEDMASKVQRKAWEDDKAKAIATATNSQTKANMEALYDRIKPEQMSTGEQELNKTLLAILAAISNDNNLSPEIIKYKSPENLLGEEKRIGVLQNSPQLSNFGSIANPTYTGALDSPESTESLKGLKSSVDELKNVISNKSSSFLESAPSLTSPSSSPNVNIQVSLNNNEVESIFAKLRDELVKIGMLKSTPPTPGNNSKTFNGQSYTNSL